MLCGAQVKAQVVKWSVLDRRVASELTKSRLWLFTSSSEFTFTRMVGVGDTQEIKKPVPNRTGK